MQLNLLKPITKGHEYRSWTRSVWGAPHLLPSLGRRLTCQTCEENIFRTSWRKARSHATGKGSPFPTSASLQSSPGKNVTSDNFFLFLLCKIHRRLIIWKDEVFILPGYQCCDLQLSSTEWPPFGFFWVYQVKVIRITPSSFNWFVFSSTLEELLEDDVLFEPQWISGLCHEFQNYDLYITFSDSQILYTENSRQLFLSLLTKYNYFFSLMLMNVWRVYSFELGREWWRFD